MVELDRPDDEYLNDFRIGVDFTVTARDIGEASEIVDMALQGENLGGVPVVTREREAVDEHRSWGLLDWKQVPPRPSQAALIQDRYPGLVNDAAAMEMLQALIQAGDRRVSLSDLVPEATRDRVAEIVESLNREVLVDDPDSPGRLVYEGPATEAAAYLAEGTYRAFDREDREHALVVTPSELASSGRVSQAIPKDRHDSRTLDEVAALLGEYTPEQSLPDLFRQVNRRVETTRRAGFPSWVPLGSEPERGPTATTEPTPEAEPARVYVEAIVWTDLEDQEPTVVVDTDSVRLARNVATTLYENLDGDPGFLGAAEFLENHQSPAQWETPEDVDAWLEALDSATPYPAVSIQRLGVGAPPPGAAPDAAPAVETTPVAAAGGEPAEAQLTTEKPLITYEVPVDFSVSAHTREQARQMVDDALTGGVPPATPGMVQRDQHLRADGDVEGVLGWQHPEHAAAGTWAHQPDPVSAVLDERAQDLDPSGGDSLHRLRTPGQEGERREPL